MASLREQLAARVAGLARRTAEAVTGRLRAVIRPAPPAPERPPAPPTPTRPAVTPRPPLEPRPPVAPISTRPTAGVPEIQRPVAPAGPPPVRTRPSPPPAPRAPGWEVEVAPDPARAEPAVLIQQLSSLQAATSNLVQRLRELGYEDAASAILGTPVPPPPPREQRPPRIPEPPPAPPPPPPILPPEVPPQQQEPEEQEPEEQEVPEEYRPPRYLLNGPAIRIPWFPPEEAFDRFNAVWDRVGIGGPRDPDDPTRGLDAAARYAADAVAVGSAMDPGVRIPLTALRSKDAFVSWAKEKGYGPGLSIVVDGLLPKGGQPISPMDPRNASASRDRQKHMKEGERPNVRNVAYWTPKLEGDE